MKGGERMLLGLFTKIQTRWFMLKERFTNESGAVATEYALLLLLIAVAIVAAAGFLGKAIADKFTSACTQLQGGAC
jgi:Flp pilus assembly pilin Flp